ncbi:TatD family hydrolase [beta proteobacterium MWH-UniP1]
MLIDSHCHLDYLDMPQVLGGLEGALARSRAAGVRAIVVPSVYPANFQRVQDLAHAQTEVFYALGIHPMYVDDLGDEAIVALDNALDRCRHDPKLVAVGEIGLDHYVPGLDREKMERFYAAQCRLARDYDLPVILHVRKAQDRVLKFLRQFKIHHGIAHAFNGSRTQADAFIQQGLVLGFGGAMTFTRAAQIRRLAMALPIESIVLETDSPDISPSWKSKGEANEPAEVLPIAQCLADLRGVSLEEVSRQSQANLMRALPRLSLP